MWIGTALSPNPGKFKVIFPTNQSLTGYDTEDVPLPDTLSGVDSTVDFNTWVRGVFTRTYLLGGHTDNLVFTEHKYLLRMSINPPSCPIVNGAPVGPNDCGITLVAGPGLTGQVSYALRFRDTLHNRRSPLSAGSPIVAVANQGASFVGVPAAPVPADPCVDIIEIWASVDGDFYRHLADRDIGATSFVVNEDLTGEAYTAELTPWPKLAFGTLANDCLFAAGDPRHPERVYVSEVGFPEEYGGTYIPTRNGETVIGIKAVGSSTIYVQCPSSSYYIQGFGTGDLVMRSLKPHIGGLGQHTIALADDIALIPTQRGVFRFDGTSMVLIGEDWDYTWRKNVIQYPDLYQNGFAKVDLVKGIVKFHIRTGVPVGGGVPVLSMPVTQYGSLYWVINLGGLIPEVGGSGRADLSFDQRGDVAGYNNRDTTAAMMWSGDGKIGNFYTADFLGNVMLENVERDIDFYPAGATPIPGVSPGGPITAVFHTQHHRVQEAPDQSDAWQYQDVWANYQCEYMQTLLEIFSGNDFAWQSSTPEQFTIPSGRLQSGIQDPLLPPIAASLVPRDKYLVHPASSPGSCISVRLSVTQDAAIPSGGPLGGSLDQDSQFVWYGWGFVAIDGSEFRPPGFYQGGG